MGAEPNAFHLLRVQETATNPEADAENPLLALSLEEVEETSGELHLRLAMAFRLLGEEHADRVAPGERSARWHVAALVALTELTAHTLGAVAAGASAVASPRLDRHAAAVGAVMYAAPTIPALTNLLEQDRRRLASLGRALEAHLDETHETPFGLLTLRHLLVTALVAEPARCAVLIERLTLFSGE